ncbi:phosphodiester glycosidase family protein [Haloimpatiens sp. FM7315]|uniref:phosphodiester glycosidase family protein n=1 Tax=Haloimpatiens sp. FM7315 TaxID=3298609 RepID=UPI00370C6F78
MKDKIRLKSVVKILVFQVIIIAITVPIFVFYGPFYNVKKHVVESSMTSLSHKYIAKFFLSQHEIEKLLNSNEIVIDEQKNLEEIARNIKNNSYDNLHIEKYEIKSERFIGYILKINSPKKIRVGYSSSHFKNGETTSKIADRKKAVAAINAGGFQYKKQNNAWISKGTNPIGIIISKSKIINPVQNEEEKNDTIAFTEEGVLLVGKYSLKELTKKKTSEAVSFGPALVVNGKGTIIKGDGGWGIAPRTAIGQKKDGSVLFLVIDGRQTNSYGATLKDIQNVMIKFGAYSGANLDGGSSSTMFYKGKTINNPSSPLGERTVPSIIYVEN